MYLPAVNKCYFELTLTRLEISIHSKLKYLEAATERHLTEYLHTLYDHSIHFLNKASRYLSIEFSGIIIDTLRMVIIFSKNENQC